MQIVKNPPKKNWTALLARPAMDTESLEATVREIMLSVKKDRDKAVKKYTKLFDGHALKAIQVSSKEIREQVKQVPEPLKVAIGVAFNNIHSFHRAQLVKEKAIETMPGVKCWRESKAIEKVGLYIPGGTAPLFSTLLMLGIPAVIAGCKEIVVCTPPDKKGNIHPAILYTASLLGITKIYKVGGVQAIAAMCFGTETIPKVYKIFGPGNQYVNAAKLFAPLYQTAIDMPAGPSEVCILADEAANPSFIAADLLSQAEHGLDSQVLLISTSSSLVKMVLSELDKQIVSLPRKDFVQAVLKNSKAIIVQKKETMAELANAYAAEHLIINCSDEAFFIEKIANAGSIFLGKYSPESAGDYASGTNHTLPTNGFAHMYSGVSVDQFVKKITYQKLSAKGLVEIRNAVVEMAMAEGLQAHASAVLKRLETL